MCGIAGFVNDMPIDMKCPVLQRMTDMIAHRGPDSEGHYIDEHAALGHRRLSIIDLGGGQQPIYNEDGSKVITFNGEIYNYQTLREELIAAGHTFTTKSDTEVLLHGYEQWGVDLLQRVRGMFTFVIWDKNKQELFGARDHFGIKPFYYAKMNGTFMYASEIKSLLRHPDFVKELNAEALKPYMTFQYPAIGETFFKGVYKLPEGHYFTYRDGKMDIHRYYDEDFREGKQKLGELVNSIDQTVCDSVKAHQIADVEVGSFLSSGVDSSYVAAVARPQHTYSIGFGKGTYNESQQAGELAELLKLNNTAESLTDEEAFAAFPRIQWHLDEPDSNPSCVPLYFLSALAAKDVKVVLSGEGADELFAGYIDYGVHTKFKPIKVVTRWLTHLPAGARKAIARFCKGKTFPGAWHLYANLAPAEESFIGQARVFEESQSEQLLKPEYRKAPSVQSIVDKTYARVEGKGLSELKKKQYLDMHQWMPGDILLKADKMCMAHSLELRVPFLDKKVMEFAEHIPANYRVNEEGCKLVLRHAANRTLPDEWATRKKVGFPVPVKFWLREQKYYDYVKEYFTAPWAADFFDTDALMKLLDDHFEGRALNQRKIYTTLTFLIWYKRFFIDENKSTEVAA